MSTLSTLRPAPTVTSARGTASAYVFDGWTIVLGIFAVSNLANGAWMLAVPVHWLRASAGRGSGLRPAERALRP
jgi:hypothetical protein